MRLYSVRYWQEGGVVVSNWYTVIVAAKTAKDAIEFVNKKMCVYKCDRNATSAKILKEKPDKAFIVEYL